MDRVESWAVETNTLDLAKPQGMGSRGRSLEITSPCCNLAVKWLCC